MNSFDVEVLFRPFELPCGRVLKNRIAKSAMSDSLGDGRGNPTDAQLRIYERWAEGGIALSIIGEVQGSPHFAEKPGNLVLDGNSDAASFENLARRGSANATQLWLQLGHAGAMAYPPISSTKGPSAINSSGLTCTALTLSEIQRLPSEFARTAQFARRFGFGGVEIHAAHGFLLSQFLSPLFNRRGDAYGGSPANRMRLLFEVVDDVRKAVGPDFPVGLKLNASDQLEGGLTEADALDIVSRLDGSGLDFIDISGGTYFPGAKSASDGAGAGPYFLAFAKEARQRTGIPLMLTGGFKSCSEAVGAVAEGSVDIVGLARALVLEPELPERWRADPADNPAFPRFSTRPEGGVTAWYTMRIARLAEANDMQGGMDIEAALKAYEDRDAARVALWKSRFPS